MLFEYRRSLKKAQLLELSAYLVFVSLILSLAVYFIFILPASFGLSGGKAILVGLGGIIPFLIWNLMRLNRAVGEWHVQVSPDAVIWHVPENIGEESFSLRLNEIAAVVYEISRSNETDNRYYIETVTGKAYPLHPAFSGVPMGRFCRALEQAGVKFETRIKA